MKKIIIATICIYGMPLLAMHANILRTPNALLSAFGTNLATIESHLKPNAHNAQNILDASRSLAELLMSLAHIELSLALPVNIDHNRRIMALRHRVCRAIENSVSIVSEDSINLRQQALRYNVAPRAEQKTMIAQLYFITELYNNVLALQHELTETKQQELQRAQANIAHIRNNLDL